MHAKKILVPTDFSSSSEAALKLATALARDTGATLLLVNVEEVPLTAGTAEYVYYDPVISKDERRRQLSNVLLPTPSVPCERHLLIGGAAESIVRFAEDEKVDFIVMGTHGRRGLSRLLMGSVAEGVMRAAPCPVITLKQAVAAETLAPTEQIATV